MLAVTAATIALVWAILAFGRGVDGPSLLVIGRAGAILLTLAWSAAAGVHSGFNIRKQWVRGSAYSALIANSRTLAIVRFRAPTRYIKRSEVTAIHASDGSLKLKDGSSMTLHCAGILFHRVLRDFVAPLRNRWPIPQSIWSGTARLAGNSEF